jgi:hypothetical protein
VIPIGWGELIALPLCNTTKQVPTILNMKYFRKFPKCELNNTL